MEDDGAPLDGGDALEASQHGQVPLLRLGLGRAGSGARDGLIVKDRT